MNAMNRGIVVAVLGVMALQVSLTDAYLHFLRPGMRSYLVAAGAVLLVLGAAVAITSWLRDSRPMPADQSHPDHGHDHHHGSRVAWLLLLPVVVAVLTPSALDSYAAARATPFQQRQYPLENFDVEKLFRTQALVGGEPEMPLSDYIGATRHKSNVQFLQTHDVRIKGFVMPPDDARQTGRFFLTRFHIGCCAADAIPMQLDVHTSPNAKIPAKNHWAELTLRLMTPQPHHALIAVVRASSLQPISKPTNPYDYF